MSGHAPDARETLRERLVESAADRALFGGSATIDDIDAAREVGLDLDAEQDSLERLVAELAIEAAMNDRATMPAHVEARLRGVCDAMHAGDGPGAAPSSAEPATRRLAAEARPAGFGWLAAAACIALGAAGTALVLRDGGKSNNSPKGAGGDLDSYLASHPGTMRVRWSGTDDDHVVGPVRGEVCFDASTDDGVLVIEGLAPNDPTVEQYQLWIFDAARDERYPVDGGVFDVPRDRPAVVPVQARLPVATPVLFAVTVEKPGGAVVSDRRIALVARP